MMEPPLKPRGKTAGAVEVLISLWWKSMSLNISFNLYPDFFMGTNLLCGEGYFELAPTILRLISFTQKCTKHS
jgi:hypothetical protein